MPIGEYLEYTDSIVVVFREDLYQWELGGKDESDNETGESVGCQLQQVGRVHTYRRVERTGIIELRIQQTLKVPLTESKES